MLTPYSLIQEKTGGNFYGRRRKSRDQNRADSCGDQTQADQNNVIRVEEEKIKLVIFSLRGDYYAFYGKQVKEILRFREITYVPGCPDYIMGIINVRGDIESVLNLHLMMGIPETEQTRTSVL